MNKSFGFFVNRPFNIVSGLAMHRLVDVKSRGKGLVIRRKITKEKSQSFYFDAATKTIMSSKYKNLSITIGSAGRSSYLYMSKTSARWYQLFKLKGKFIQNEKNSMALDVQGGRDTEWRRVQSYRLNKSKAQ